MPQDNETIQIEGVERVAQALESAPKELIPGALLAGLKAASAVIQPAIAARIPRRVLRKGGDAHYPALAADLDHAITLDDNFRGGLAEVGFGKQGYVARLVEYGHRMVGHKPKKKVLGTVETHPFMRPAAEVSEEAAVDAFTEAFLAELERGGLVESETDAA